MVEATPHTTASAAATSTTLNMATALFSLPAQPLHPALPSLPPQDDDASDDQDNTGHRQTTNAPGAGVEDETGRGVDLGTLTGRRITLKPRRTLSLSPTPARTGDNSMGRNLRAARCLDFTDKDDDDGLYQPSDSDTEAAKKKGEDVEEVNNNTTTAGGCTKGRHKQRGGGVTAAGSSLAAALNSSSTTGSSQCRISVSVKRPLDSVLPCQEIQYLDICYQKVGTLMVQYSPIPRKKIAYHHVPYNPIPYGEVTYYGDRAVKRKPLQRSHSIAVADPSSRAWAAHTQPEDGDWASYRLSRSVAEW